MNEKSFESDMMEHDVLSLSVFLARTGNRFFYREENHLLRFATRLSNFAVSRVFDVEKFSFILFDTE